MSGKTIVIGLTGPIASGKGVVADVLKDDFGFSLFSLSHRVREIAALKGVTDVTREILQDIGDETRAMLGGDIFAKLTAALAFTDDNRRVAIDSIRNPKEIGFLSQHPNFILCAVDADFQKRWELLQQRARSSDPKTLKEFKERDSRDLGFGQDELGQQVRNCMKMADVTIYNDGTLEQLRRNAREIMKGVIEEMAAKWRR